VAFVGAGMHSLRISEGVMDSRFRGNDMIEKMSLSKNRHSRESGNPYSDSICVSLKS
jgi:hypothetical protein